MAHENGDGPHERTQGPADADVSGTERTPHIAPPDTSRNAALPQGDLFGNAPRMVNSTIVGRRCATCNGETFILRPGKGPHANGLECVSCGEKSWLSRDRAMALPLTEGSALP